MTERLVQAPIVEAVIDIDCDLPPALELEALEPAALAALGTRYPKLRKKFVEQHELEGVGYERPPVISSRRGLVALQLHSSDDRQLVQLRSHGYSFNRLAPYGSLDEYLPEIERTWRTFVGLAAPVQVRAVRLRYINRLLLPVSVAEVGEGLDRYIRVPSCVPSDLPLMVESFLHHFAARAPETGHRAIVVLASQPRAKGEPDVLPVILDIGTVATGPVDPTDWVTLVQLIHALRVLKNTVFGRTLTDECKQLFQA